MDLSPHRYLERHAIDAENEVTPFAIGKNVLLHVEKEAHERQRDSSRASSRALCEYKWDNKMMFPGRILSVRNRLVAYRLYNEKKGEVIRILDREERSRHLIKDFRAPTVDLQWAMHRPLLAVVDSDGSLYIYDVEASGKECSKFLNIMRERSGEHKHARVSWCPFIPDPDVEPLDLLVFTSGKIAQVINISRIKAAKEGTEINANDINLIPGGVFTIELESNVTIARLSPDGSALVVAEANGLAHFYVVEETSIRIAHEFTPISNQFVEDIVFFDNLTLNDQVCYWKYAAISSDNGQRITLFDCDNWDLVGKLRFEMPSATKLEFALDLTAKYLFVFDYAKNNVFCVEIAYVNDVPHFASTTMIAFFNTLFIACPVNVEESNDTSDLFDDDEGSTSGNASLVALLVAICPRSLLEINIDLERTNTFEPALLPVAKPLTAQTIQEELSPLPSASPIRNIPASVKSPPVEQPEELKVPSPVPVPIATVEPTPPPVASPAVDLSALTSFLDEKFKSFESKVSVDLQQVNLELQGLRSQSRNDLETAMEHITNEFRNRNEQLERLISTYTQRVRDQVVAVVEEGFAHQSKYLQEHTAVSNGATLDAVRSVVTSSVVPSLDRLSKELFQQFSDNLSLGVREFNNSLAKIHNELRSSGNTPRVSDTLEKVINLVENHEVEGAFELALTHRDQTALMAIVSRADLETFFTSESTSLRLPYLLVLLEMLVQNLAVDTALKLHTVELILSEINVDDPAHKPNVISTMEIIGKAMEPMNNSDHKRSARVIKQLAFSFIKSIQQSQ